jgi:hypothetical protein
VAVSSPYAELIAFRIEHDSPAASVSLSILDLRRAESDQSLDLVRRVLGSEVDVHSALRRSWFWNLPEQDPADAAVVGRCERNEVILFSYGAVARDFRPESREPSWISTVEGDVFDERRHGATLTRIRRLGRRTMVPTTIIRRTPTGRTQRDGQSLRELRDTRPSNRGSAYPVRLNRSLFDLGSVPCQFMMSR